MAQHNEKSGAAAVRDNLSASVVVRNVIRVGSAIFAGPEGDEKVSRRRIGAFALLLSAMSFGLYLVEGFSAGLAPGTEGMPAWLGLGRGLHLGLAVAMATLGVLGLSDRTSIPPTRLDTAVVLLFVALSCAMGLSDPYPPRLSSLLLTTTAIVVIGRAVLIPSSPTRTLMLSLGGVVPVLVALTLMDWQIPDMGPARLAARGVRFGIELAVVAGIAGGASRVLASLRREASANRILGQYTLHEKLGEGGMGAVYRAQHAMLHRPSAIKLISPSVADPNALSRFEQEVQLTSQLSHPNTVAVYDYGRTSDGTLYYVMELLDGVDLQRLVDEDGPQPPERVIHLLIQVCGSLAEAHRAGLIHRDIKPANVILCERGGEPDVAKVVDFGLVKSVKASANSEITAENTVAGSPNYMPPEYIRGALDPTPAGDLYSLGGLAYFLLTGTTMFSGATALETCSHQLHTPPTPPSVRLGKTIPGDLEEIVMTCLQKQPEERPKDAVALRIALSSCSIASAWTTERAWQWWEERRRGVRSAGATATPPQPSTAKAEPTVPLHMRAKKSP